MAGLKVSKIKKRPKDSSITLDFGEAGNLTLVFDAKGITVGFIRQLSDAGRDDDYGRLAELFFSVVKSWDLLDEDDEPMPLTEESVDELGWDVFVEIVDAMGKLYDQKKETPDS